MAFSADCVKSRSLGLWPILLAAAPLALGGCIILDDDDGHHGGWQDDTYEPPPPAAEPMLVRIDTDATINAEPGEGVGLFVEYAAGGAWRFWTTCDTNYSNVACTFDVLVSVQQPADLVEFSGYDLDGSDAVELYDLGSVYLAISTGSDIDGLMMTTEPGAIVRLEMYLDGVSQPRFVYWFGDGVLHTGAPTNPVDFEPITP
jgi:hypothetical protein